ncbi:MAG: hotdog domain-containing protein, partial [Burkholderiales bacterium]
MTDPTAQPASVEQPNLPTDQNLVMRLLTSMAELNPNGSVFGGWIMARVDVAAGIEAMRVTQGPCTTVAVKEFIFKQAVYLDDLLSFYTSVEKIGNTSVTIHVEV